MFVHNGDSPQNNIMLSDQGNSNAKDKKHKQKEGVPNHMKATVKLIEQGVVSLWEKQNFAFQGIYILFFFYFNCLHFPILFILHCVFSVMSHQDTKYLVWWVSYDALQTCFDDAKQLAPLWLAVSKSHKLSSSKRHSTRKTPIKFKGLAMTIFSNDFLDMWQKYKTTFDSK